jgi:hypothetical protein
MKLMAVVIIVLMVGFVGGSALQRFLQSRFSGQKKVVAYYGDGEKIRNLDFMQARKEIELLKSLKADMLLSSQGLDGALLGELIFSEGRIRPQMLNQLNKFIRQNDCMISQSQLADIYSQKLTGNLCWLLLKKESQAAGIYIPTQTAGNILGNIIPQMFQNASYSQVMGSIVERTGMPEQQVLSIFSRLMAILQYGKMMCSTADITENEIRYLISSQAETLGANTVNLSSVDFIDEVSKPSEAEISSHFEKYKNNKPLVTEDNPYGFGYKLPALAEIEYLSVKLDDVEKITDLPTQEDAEQFYQRNRERFKEEIPVDPNDPNSEMTERQQSYPEVADELFEYLKQSRINSKAQKILKEAKQNAQKPIETLSKPIDELTGKDFSENSVDYGAIAENLQNKYKIDIYYGKTGLLSAEEIQRDQNLSRLFMQSSPAASIPLVKLVFAVNELDLVDLSIYGNEEYSVYESFGPLKDRYSEIMTIARVTSAKNETVPQSINYAIDKTPMFIDDSNLPSTEFSVKEQVVEDLENKAALEIAEKTAETFIANVKNTGWEEAIEKLNYKFDDTKDPNIPDKFTLRKANFRRIPTVNIKTLKQQNSDNPAMENMLNNIRSRKILSDSIFKMLNETGRLKNPPAKVVSKPEFTVYVLKNAVLNKINQQEFNQVKPMQIFRRDSSTAASLSAVFYNPDNLAERMNFEWKEETEPTLEDTNDVNSAAN